VKRPSVTGRPPWPAPQRLGETQDWPLQNAETEWGYEMANYRPGRNSRVRGERARRLLGWVPTHDSALRWGEHEML